MGWGSMFGTVTVVRSSAWPTCAICGVPMIATYTSSWPPAPPAYRCPVIHIGGPTDG